MMMMLVLMMMMMMPRCLSWLRFRARLRHLPYIYIYPLVIIHVAFPGTFPKKFLEISLPSSFSGETPHLDDQSHCGSAGGGLLDPESSLSE